MSSERLLKVVTVVTVLTDIVLIFAAFGIAYVIRYQLQWFRDVDPAYFTTFLPYLPMAGLQAALTLIAFALEGVFRPKRGASLADEIYGVINGVTTGFVVEVFILFFWRPLVYSRLIFVYATALIMLFIILARVVRRSILSYLRSRGMGLDRVLIVGAENIGLTVMRNLIAQPELGFEVVGFVDDHPERGQTDIGRFRALGSTDRLPQLLQEEAIDEVIVALPWNERRKILDIVNLCTRTGVRPRVVPDLFQISLSMVDMRNVAGLPMLSLHEPTLSPWARAFKRFIDVFGAGFGLILLSPFLLVIALAIRLDSRGPALFRQYRVGRHGKLFQVVKFRSMVRDAEALKSQVSHLNEAQGAMFKIREDPRVTRTGRFLRRTSLDELPQLWNVLRGDMSLVGPRPALPEEVAEYADWHRQRLATAPGMTGLWQVSGRSELPFDEMVLLDIYYIENWTPFTDLSILLRTIPRVLAGSGRVLIPGYVHFFASYSYSSSYSYSNATVWLHPRMEQKSTRRRSRSESRSRRSGAAVKHWRLLALLAAGLALRLALMPRPDPFDADLTTFWLPWMNYAGQHGLAQLYLHGEPVVNYPPFYMVLLTGMGKLYGALVPGFGYTPLQSVLIKLPAVIADLAVGAMLYVAALRVTSDKATNPSEASAGEPESGPGAKPAGSSTALLAAGLWLLNPAVIYVSSFWAQVDAVHTMWMVAALLAALGKRWGWSGLLIGLGLLTKLQAVVILPLLLLLAWWNGWRAVGRWSGGLAAVLAAGGLASLTAGVLAPVLDTYTNAVGFYPALSMNAYNPWFVIQFASSEFAGRTLTDAARVVGPVTLRWVGMALLAGYGLAILWTLHRRWQPRTAGRSDWPAAGARLDTFFAAGLLVFGFFTLATEMHERYVLPALAFLALPAARGRQRLLAYLLLSGAVALNLLRVLPFAPAVYFTFERIPGDRVLIALASTALFIWWTLIYLRAGSTVATEKEENDGLATLSHGLQ